MMANKPNENAPHWIKCKLSIKREALKAWLQSCEDSGKDEWINLNVKESARNGKWYVDVDTWKTDHGTPTAPVRKFSNVPVGRLSESADQRFIGTLNAPLSLSGIA